ncbi:MAG: hypothetical protein Q8L79_07955 [Methylobacter sp.]|uniref:hypothetical protein n=1 Tax=Methylobacter sp. TaxID=2051955 RepID=UPI00272F22AD|nr:hypothetical protein [Methylobacter sp.]MDP1665048.1 hypothetical protein [Methylobacter sp.]
MHSPSFSLLDLPCRTSFNSTNLDRDINLMVSIFNKTGAWNIANEQQRLTNEAAQTDLRLVGIGLGSSLDLVGIYYSWYRKNKGDNRA